MDYELPYLSASRIKCYLSCPQKFKLQYVLKTPWAFQPSAMVLGIAVHEAIEVYYKTWMDGRRLSLSDMHDVFEESWRTETDGKRLDVDDPEPAKNMGKDLVATFHDQVRPQNVMAIEYDFRVPLLFKDSGEVLGVDLVGRIDLIEADNAGNIVIADSKTMARRPSEQDLAIDLQLSAYAYAARQLGIVHADETVLLRIDALMKTKTPAFIQLFTTRTPDSDTQFVRLAADIIHAVVSGAFPANPGWQCGGCVVGDTCYLKNS
ncbi:PD-(D/E)XK nuclease superfamily protein [bacterium BMS3Bbin04]|nr:PD-(D/E)XK nuclease superfamily protein [bacterium BMS3Bbin04]